MDSLYKKLVDTHSISGKEQHFQTIVESELSPFCKVDRDQLKNAFFRFGSGEKTVTLSAHADEVGFIVTYISDDGFIYFQPVGGIKYDIAVGSIVVIYTATGPVKGIIGRAKAKQPSEISSFEDLWIDSGAGGNVKDIVSVGDVIGFDVGYYDLPNRYALSRGADNKLGVFTLIKTMQNVSKKPNQNLTVCAITTSQEEIGSRGAKLAFKNTNTEYSIVLETTNATDSPESQKKKEGEVILGNGPVITRGANTNDNMFQHLLAIAKKNGIPYQLIAETREASNDARVTQIQGSGESTAIINLPVRYMHFTAQIFHWDDVENAIRLVSAYLGDL